MGIATAVGWRKLNSLCFFPPVSAGCFSNAPNGRAFTIGKNHPQQKPLMSASWQNVLKTVHHIGCCFFLLAMSKGVPALKDHQKLDKSYGWGPSFPPQNPGLKPGAWGWNLEPGVETWRFVKKPLETHGWSMKCWISPSTSRSKTTKLKLDRIHPPQN